MRGDWWRQVLYSTGLQLLSTNYRAKPKRLGLPIDMEVADPKRSNEEIELRSASPSIVRPSQQIKS
eukprot:scaffold15752_cov83-Skeletonema_dohrnii-CCMP3373.AAC.3